MLSIFCNSASYNKRHEHVFPSFFIFFCVFSVKLALSNLAASPCHHHQLQFLWKRIFFSFLLFFYFTAHSNNSNSDREKVQELSHCVWCYIEKHNQLFFRSSLCNAIAGLSEKKNLFRPTASCASVCKDNGKMSLLNIYIYESTVTSKAKNRWTLLRMCVAKGKCSIVRSGRFFVVWGWNDE